MDIRSRQVSAMTYDEYVNTYNKEPQSPKLLPLQAPNDDVSDLELTPIKQLPQKLPLQTQSERLIPIKRNSKRVL